MVSSTVYSHFLWHKLLADLSRRQALAGDFSDQYYFSKYCEKNAWNMNILVPTNC